jgi:hypothetical protein
MQILHFDIHTSQSSHTAGRKIFFKSLTVDGITEKRGNRIAKVVFRRLDGLWRRDVHSRCDQGAANVLIRRGHGACCGKVEGMR